MARKEKIGNRVGVADWRSLESAGDVKRFLRWCVHSIRDQNLDPKTGVILSQIANTLLKTIQVTDVEDKIRTLEDTLHRVHQQLQERGIQ